MEGLATEAGKTFLEQGLLGALFLFAIGGMVFLYRKREECANKNVEHLEKMLIAQHAFLKAIDANTLATEGVAKAMDSRATALLETAKNIADLRQFLEIKIQSYNSRDQATIEMLKEIRQRIGRTEGRDV